MVTVHDRRTEQKMIRAGVFRHSREEMLRVLLLFSDDVTVPDRGGFFLSKQGIFLFRLTVTEHWYRVKPAL